uniref:Uncharacterized protein MANES_01G254400 n=1 Tax=Rhizophora mucronata TaxID=61149 RepID=A0A2P2MRD1_RHIMU
MATKGCRFGIHIQAVICLSRTFCSWTQNWNLIENCTLWGFFQMLVLLLVSVRECHFQHAQSFHVLSHSLKHKLYCIASSDIFFRWTNMRRLYG